MISQKQMREWIPNAVATFRSAMPPISIQFPMIYIASKHTMEKVVAQISDSIQCDPSQITASSSTMMEFIPGSIGNAILICQDAFRGKSWTIHQEEHFQHHLWHEHGHFFAYHNESSDGLFRYMKREAGPLKRVLGYHFWSEFIAETIALNISSVSWVNLHEELRFSLMRSFGADQESRSYYNFAWMFALSFAVDGIKPGISNRTGALPDKMIASEAVSLISNMLSDFCMLPFQCYIEDLFCVLKAQLGKAAFWEITQEDLDVFGDWVLAIEACKIKTGNRSRFRGLVLESSL
ncbi:MAG: hypothetical protein IKH57_06535 [Clostridia bacterium]|nr:hypothetical protein [Clostridia bacterium]